MSRKTMPFGPVTLEVLRAMHDRACERVRQIEQEVEQTRDRLQELEQRHAKQRELCYHLTGCIQHFALLDDEHWKPVVEEMVGELGVPAATDAKQYWTGE